MGALLIYLAIRALIEGPELDRMMQEAAKPRPPIDVPRVRATLSALNPEELQLGELDEPQD